MPRYIINSTHTAEECLQTLDEILAQGPQTLAQHSFGCAAGDHSNHAGYTTVEASSEAAARNTLPGLLRARAQVVEVGSFTPEQIRSFHA